MSEQMVGEAYDKAKGLVLRSFKSVRSRSLFLEACLIMLAYIFEGKELPEGVRIPPIVALTAAQATRLALISALGPDANELVSGDLRKRYHEIEKLGKPQF